MAGNQIAGNRNPAHRYFSFQSPGLSRLHATRGVGLAIVTFLVWHYDARSVLRLLAREQPGYFAAAIGVYLSTQVISAYRWRLLAAILQLNASFADFLAFRFIATFANTIVPGVVGGDALRAIYLGR